MEDYKLRDLRASHTLGWSLSGRPKAHGGCHLPGPLMFTLVATKNSPKIVFFMLFGG